MLIIDYCPHRSEDDESVVFLPDDEVKGYVEETINTFLHFNKKPATEVHYHVRIGNELIMTQFRVSIRQAIRENKMTSNDVEFRFDNEVLKLDKDGRIGVWPTGFCDYSERLYMQLLNWE